MLLALPPEIRAEIEQEYTHIMESHELIRKLAQTGNSGSGSGSGGGALTNTGFQLKASSTAAAISHDLPPPLDQGTSRSKTRGRGGPRGRPRGSRARGRGRGQINDHPERADDMRFQRDDAHGNGSTTATGQAQPKARAQPEELELDADFLAALPQDIRAEVEAAHRVELIKNRRRQEADLAAQKDAAAASRQGFGGGSVSNELQGPVLERPTLMGKREIGELRVLLTQWVQSTLVEQDLSKKKGDRLDQVEKKEGRRGRVETVVLDEGPNPDDVQSFVDFVARVIVMERDLERVRLMLKYLRRRIEDNERQVEPLLQPVGQGRQHAVLGVVMSWQQAFEWVLSVARQLVVHIYGGSFDLD